MFQYDSVEDALEALKNGEVILVTDDEDRENEGILSVPPRRQPQKMSISWLNMPEV